MHLVISTKGISFLPCAVDFFFRMQKTNPSISIPMINSTKLIMIATCFFMLDCLFVLISSGRSDKAKLNICPIIFFLCKRLYHCLYKMLWEKFETRGKCLILMYAQAHLKKNPKTKKIEKKIPDSEVATFTNRSCPPESNLRISMSSANQSKQPVPPSLIFNFAYAVQEQFLEQICSHSLRVMVKLYQEEDVSGNFTCVSLRKTSLVLLQLNGILRRHLVDVEDFDSKPCKHVHD